MAAARKELGDLRAALQAELGIQSPGVSATRKPSGLSVGYARPATPLPSTFPAATASVMDSAVATGGSGASKSVLAALRLVEAQLAVSEHAVLLVVGRSMLSGASCGCACRSSCRHALPARHALAASLVLGVPCLTPDPRFAALLTYFLVNLPPSQLASLSTCLPANLPPSQLASLLFRHRAMRMCRWSA